MTKKIITVVVAASVSVLLSALCFSMLPTPAPAGDFSLLIKVYEVRLECAKIDLQTDELNCEYRKERLDRNQHLGRTKAVSDSELQESTYAYRQACNDLAYSRQEVAEAEAQLKLITEAVKSGKVSWTNLSLGLEGRVRRVFSNERTTP